MSDTGVLVYVVDDDVSVREGMASLVRSFGLEAKGLASGQEFLAIPQPEIRKDDILMLVEYFVQRYARRVGKNIHLIDKKTPDLLQSCGWSGNIRELQNVCFGDNVVTNCERSELAK